MCLPAVPGHVSKNAPTPVLAEFNHQLLTANQDEASRAFVPLVSLLEKILADAADAGVVRRGVARDEVAGIVLSTIMFNAAYSATILAGTPAWSTASRAGQEIGS